MAIQIPLKKGPNFLKKLDNKEKSEKENQNYTKSQKMFHQNGFPTYLMDANWYLAAQVVIIQIPPNISNTKKNNKAERLRKNKIDNDLN